MTETQDTAGPLRDRIKDLNTKAYYLIVALSFLYAKGTTSPTLLRWAITLTALVAVLPVQDYFKSKCALECIRAFKMLFLVLALICMFLWLW